MVRNVRSISLFLSAIVLAGTLGAALHAAEKNIVMLIPDRHTMVQLATDIADMKPVAVIAYSAKAGNSALLLHAWDPAGRRWIRVSEEDFRSGAIFRVLPSEALVVGTDAALRSAVASAVCLDVPVKEVNTLDNVVLVNTLDDRLSFGRRQWSFLQKKYNLEVKDLNGERRRYGKYGPPSSSTRRPNRDSFTVELEEDMPFEVVIEPELPSAEEADAPTREPKSWSPVEAAIPADETPVVSDMTAEEMGLAGVQPQQPENK